MTELRSRDRRQAALCLIAGRRHPQHRISCSRIFWSPSCTAGETIWLRSPRHSGQPHSYSWLSPAPSSQMDPLVLLKTLDSSSFVALLHSTFVSSMPHFIIRQSGTLTSLGLLEESNSGSSHAKLIHFHHSPSHLSASWFSDPSSQHNYYSNLILHFFDRCCWTCQIVGPVGEDQLHSW